MSWSNTGIFKTAVNINGLEMWDYVRKLAPTGEGVYICWDPYTRCLELVRTTGILPNDKPVIVKALDKDIETRVRLVPIGTFSDPVQTMPVTEYLYKRVGVFTLVEALPLERWLELFEEWDQAAAHPQVVWTNDPVQSALNNANVIIAKVEPPSPSESTDMSDAPILIPTVGDIDKMPAHLSSHISYYMEILQEAMMDGEGAMAGTLAVMFTELESIEKDEVGKGNIGLRSKYLARWKSFNQPPKLKKAINFHWWVPFDIELFEFGVRFSLGDIHNDTEIAFFTPDDWAGFVDRSANQTNGSYEPAHVERLINNELLICLSQHFVSTEELLNEDGKRKDSHQILAMAVERFWAPVLHDKWSLPGSLMVAHTMDRMKGNMDKAGVKGIRNTNQYIPVRP